MMITVQQVFQFLLMIGIACAVGYAAAKVNMMLERKAREKSEREREERRERVRKELNKRA